MTLRAAIVLLTGGLPFFASAHNFVEGERVAPVGVAERGELQLQQGELRYQAWNSARLSGKVAWCCIWRDGCRPKIKTPR